MKSMLMMVMVTVATATLAQTASAQAPADKALQDAAAARTKSMGAGDAQGWGKYTTDDFIVIEADGALKTKAQRMAEIKSAGNASAATNANTDEKWRMYGPTTAVLTVQTSVNGKPTRVTSVWVKQQGEWKVASVQLTTVAADK